MSTSTACPAHFSSHQSYKLSSQLTHVSEMGPTLKFCCRHPQDLPRIFTTPWRSCLLQKHLFPSDELFIAISIYFPTRQSLARWLSSMCHGRFLLRYTRRGRPCSHMLLKVDAFPSFRQLSGIPVSLYRSGSLILYICTHFLWRWPPLHYTSPSRE